MQCNPLVGGPQTDLGELDMLHDDSYDWADRRVTAPLLPHLRRFGQLGIDRLLGRSPSGRTDRSTGTPSHSVRG